MKKEKASYIEGAVSIIVNILLFGLKLWAGIVSGSIALVADAWHTLSDSISSIIVIVGAKLSSKKADKEHPFGHGRWEYIAAIFIGFLLGIIAFDFMKDSISQFQSKESANFGTVAIVVTIVSIFVKEGLAQFAFFLGKKTDNISVKADAWHHRTDAISSVIILVGIFFKNQFWWIDSVLGIIVSLMLFYAGYEIIKEAINKLLGEKPSPDLIKKIEILLKENFDIELYPHHFHLHNYVNHKELTFHIKLDRNQTIEQGHFVATKIEKIIIDELNITATIHVDPDNVEHEMEH